MATPLPKKQTITGMVFDYIASRIISGDYPGGTQIRQDAVANELGVSRIPVREALVQLEAAGLLNIEMHKGAIVVELSIDDAIDLFDTRAVMEPFLAKLAVKSASNADIERIEKIHEAYLEKIKENADPEELSRLNWDFHIALLEPSRRKRSISLVKSLHNSADRYLRMQIKPKIAQKKAVNDHQAILDAYKARKASEVERLLRQHVKEAFTDIELYFHSLETAE